MVKFRSVPYRDVSVGALTRGGTTKSRLYGITRRLRVSKTLGLASFYRRLVPNFAAIAKSLTTLTRKDQEFIWGPSQQEAFESLKSRFCSTPVLAYPNCKLPFILTTDASKVAIAAIFVTGARWSRTAHRLR